LCFLGTICLNGHKVLDGCEGATSAVVAAAAAGHLNGRETWLIAVVAMHVVVVRIGMGMSIGIGLGMSIQINAVEIVHGGIKVGIVIVEKGGFNVSEHVVYGCLAELPWTLAMEATLQQQPWHCPQCDFELEQYDVPDQLLHRLECQGRQDCRRQATPEIKETAASSSSSRDANYHCESCGRSLKLSQIDILRHRRQCVGNK